MSGTAVLSLAALVLAACHSPAPGIPPADVATTLAVPGRANANVSLAAAGAFVAAVWSASDLDGTTDIYAATSPDGGATFGVPVRVNAEPGQARAGGEQPPRVALAGPSGAGFPVIAIVWTASGPVGTTLLTARSTDGGRTFGPSSVIPGTDAPGNRGWQSVVANPEGGMLTAWLDHRELLTRDAAVAAQHHHTGSMHSQDGVDTVAMAQLSAIYVASDAAPRRLTGGVCYCCKTSTAVGAHGLAVVAWRHVYPGNMRDIALAVSLDEGRTFSAPARVSEDLWSIAGCPDDGPVVAVDEKNRVHVIWPTVVVEDGVPRKALFYAASDDGARFSPRLQLPTRGQANHPQLAVDERGYLTVVWDESGDGNRRVAAATGMPDHAGGWHFVRETSGDPETGVYPVVAATRGGTVRAWTTGPPDASLIRIAVRPSE
jgi:hypothetical protein